MLCINFSARFCCDAAASTISLLCGIDEPQEMEMFIDFLFFLVYP